MVTINRRRYLRSGEISRHGASLSRSAGAGLSRPTAVGRRAVSVGASNSASFAPIAGNPACPPLGHAECRTQLATASRLAADLRSRVRPREGPSGLALPLPQCASSALAFRDFDPTVCVLPLAGVASLLPVNSAQFGRLHPGRVPPQHRGGLLVRVLLVFSWPGRFLRGLDSTRPVSSVGKEFPSRRRILRVKPKCR